MDLLSLSYPLHIIAFIRPNTAHIEVLIFLREDFLGMGGVGFCFSFSFPLIQ